MRINLEQFLEEIDNYPTTYVLNMLHIPIKRAQKIFNTNDVNRIKASVAVNVCILYQLENN